MSQADLSLLQQYAELGDEQAFAQLVRQYAGLVYAASRRVLGDQTLAEDVTQETFYRLMRKPETVTRSVAGWLHRTATQLAIDTLRSRTARIAREAAYARQPAAEPERWTQLSPHIDAALAKLDEPTRCLLVEHFLNSRPQRELAAERGLSPATISREIRSGLDRLRAELDRRDVQMPSAALAALLLNCPSETMSHAFAQQLGKLTLGAAFVKAGAAKASAMALKQLLLIAGVTTAAAAALAVMIAFLISGLMTQDPAPAPPAAAVLENDPAPAATAAPVIDEPRRPTGYLIMPGRDLDMRSDRVALVAIPPDDNPDRQTQVVFGDGRLVWMTAAKLDQLLVQQQGRPLRDLLYDPSRIVVERAEDLWGG